MVIKNPQDLRVRPRDSAGSGFSITVLEYDFSNQVLRYEFREGKTRKNRGLGPSSLFFAPLLSEPQESRRFRRYRRHPVQWKGRRRTLTATGPVIIRIGTAMLGIPRDRQIPGYASDIRDHRWAGPQSWLRSRILSLGRSRRGDEFSQTRSIQPNMERETFGSPPGAHQDPNSSTRSIGEPVMPEISCIASEVDDLQPLRMGPILGCYVALSMV